MDDVEGGTSTYTLNGILAPGEYKIYFNSETGIGLNNDSDTVRLLAPDGTLHDSHNYASADPDQAWSRDDAGQWHDDWPPSPGAPNVPPPTPTPTRMPTVTRTPTRTPTPTTVPAGLRLNEFLPRPASDWNGNGTISTDDEYIELRNASTFPFDLTGWQLDDVPDGGASPYTLSGTLAPGEIRVIFRCESGITLNDNGDAVRLLEPGGMEYDVYNYASSDPDHSWSRNDLDGWHDDWPPSPGPPNQPPPTPTVTPTPPTIPAGLRLNEFMPRPVSDWNGNGTVSTDDEYIELQNTGALPFDLTGWQLDDVLDGGASPYTLSGTLAPGEIRAIFRSESGITLNDNGDAVRLLTPSGLEWDAPTRAQVPIRHGAGTTRALGTMSGRLRPGPRTYHHPRPHRRSHPH